eukprot:TRINITY_DN33695_c0_g1_i1.p1 TRINITY_DN33695_c0_g1~~TRINITY_DN33695_c0_g1_i1.p1  ORF type:complete len:219 (+),score=33.55 TRINITY_DN33695_c0_g1_i1:60-716(+)
MCLFSQTSPTPPLPEPPRCGGPVKGRKLRAGHIKPLISLVGDFVVKGEAVRVCGKEGMGLIQAQTGWGASDVFEDGRLFLGSSIDAQDIATLKEKKITHVINATVDCQTAQDPDIEVLHVAVRDHSDAPLSEYFDMAANFINSVMESGGSILVHCRCGISRSTTLVAAYLIAHRNMTCEQACDFLRARRSIVSPNFGFMLSLTSYEQTAQEKCSEIDS